MSVPAFLTKDTEVPALGHLAIFTIRDRDYELKRMAELFETYEMNTTYLPTQIRAVDAFKKSIALHKEESIPVPNGAPMRVLIRNAPVSNKDYEMRLLIRESADGKFDLAHGKVAEICFYRPTTDWQGKIDQSTAMLRTSRSGRDLESDEDVAVRQHLGRIETDYNRLRRHADGSKMRHLVLNYLGYLRATAIKPSVYFCHHDRHADLLKLQKFLVAVGCEMHLIPLVDTDEQRDMVIKAYENEQTDELNALAKRMADSLSERKKISSGTFTGYLEEFQDVMHRTSEFKRKLDVTGNITEGAAEAVQALVAQLRVRMIKDNNVI